MSPKSYNLVNKNHEVKNTPAYDLVDENKRIFIQVTANKSREKIQETIDKFIKHEMYDQYDRLVIQLLTDKIDRKKVFDTKGLFRFESKHDIWCFKDLTRDIAKLDTEQLKKINDYVENEIYEKPEIIGQGRTGRRTFSNKAACVLGALIVLCIVIVFIISHTNSNKRVGKVYFSMIQPYSSAGYYTSVKDAPFVKRNDIETDMAFSIVSELRKEGEKPPVVEDVYFDILSLEPIEEPVLTLDAEIVDNILKLFVFNDGWKDAENLDVLVESEISDGLSTVGDMEMISQCTYMAECSEIKSADVLPLAEYAIDSARYQEVCEKNGCSGLRVGVYGVSGDEIAFSWSAILVYNKGNFHLEYGGGGSPPYRISLFAELDVDSNPAGLSFTGQNTMSIVEDVTVLDTVIAPTKSCVVQCQNIFYINGEPQQTPVFTARVTVPVFSGGAIGSSGLLTRELAQLSPGDRIGIERVIARYYYQAKSIKDAFYVTE